MKKIGVLFDMDGVLVDSEPVITAAACEALRRFGVPAQHEDFKPFTGMGEVRFVGGVAEKYGFSYRPEMKDLTYEIYGEKVDDNLIIYPPTRSTLMLLRDRGYSIALASSADLIKVNHNLRVAGIAPELFDAVVAAEHVERKKPFPDIFLYAAERIGVPIEDCFVVEDAVSGVLAGKAAGATVIAVLTSFPESELLNAGADRVVQDIAGVPDAILALTGRKT